MDNRLRELQFLPQRPGLRVLLLRLRKKLKTLTAQRSKLGDHPLNTGLVLCYLGIPPPLANYRFRPVSGYLQSCLGLCASMSVLLRVGHSIYSHAAWGFALHCLLWGGDD
jgi:hypothetical protein